MILGEILIKLGITGDKKAKDSLESVRSKIGDTGSSALAMKASIVGALWGLERMMSASNGAGAGLVNFAASTGMSMKALQEWKYAAQQVNVSGAEVEGSMKSLQMSMTGMLQGAGDPKGMGMFSDFMAKMGEPFDRSKARDMDYMLSSLQKFAQSGDADVVKDKVMSFGVSENMFAAMRQNAFRPEVFKNAPKYSEGQAMQLAKTNAAWSNLGQTIEMAFGKFNSKHGLKMVQDITKVTGSILALANSLATLADKFKIFEKISDAFEGLAMIGDIMSGKGVKGFDTSAGGMWDILKGGFITAKEYEKDNHLAMTAGVIPTMRPDTDADRGTTNVNVTNNMNYKHEGKNSKQNANDVGKATKDALRMMPSSRVKK